MRLSWPCWIGAVADDLDRQRQFYRDVLGLAELAAGEDWVHFDLGGSRLLGSTEVSGRWCYFRDAEGNVFELKEQLAPS